MLSFIHEQFLLYKIIKMYYISSFKSFAYILQHITFIFVIMPKKGKIIEIEVFKSKNFLYRW